MAVRVVRRPRWSSTVGLISVAVIAASCNSDGPDAGSSASSVAAAEAPTDSAFALATCNALRAFDNQLVDVVNGSVAGISSLPAGERPPLLLGGLDDARAAVQAWDDGIDSIDLPALDEAAELRRQLHRGAAEALSELDDQSGEWATLPAELPDDEVQGEVGIWFNTIEKVMSVSEPEIFTFDRVEFKQAFLDEPNCRNVIQQFVND